MLWIASQNRSVDARRTILLFIIYYIIVHEVQNTHIQRKVGLKNIKSNHKITIDWVCIMLGIVNTGNELDKPSKKDLLLSASEEELNSKQHASSCATYRQ